MQHGLGAAAAGAVLVVCVAAGGAAASSDVEERVICEGPDAARERAALVNALRLLPRLPPRVAVIDVTRAAPDVRATLLRLDAFVVTGSPVVYVLRQSRLLAGARDGGAVHAHALAAVLWHELAHLEGGDEAVARRREEDLWRSFIRDQRLDAIVALRYLKALTERPDDTQLATAGREIVQGAP